MVECAARGRISSSDFPVPISIRAKQSGTRVTKPILAKRRATSRAWSLIPKDVVDKNDSWIASVLPRARQLGRNPGTLAAKAHLVVCKQFRAFNPTGYRHNSSSRHQKLTAPPTRQRERHAQKIPSGFTGEAVPRLSTSGPITNWNS